MNARAPRLLALAAVAAIQLAVPVAMIVGHERTLETGLQWRFRTEPVDPADAFRGRYLALAFADTAAAVPAGVEIEAGDDVYVPLRRDAAGFAVLGPVALEPPATRDYLAVEVRWVDREQGAPRAHVELPFGRLYLEEGVAPAAEKAYFEAVGRAGAPGARPAWALVRVLDGRAVLEDVVVDGQPIRELVAGTAR